MPVQPAAQRQLQGGEAQEVAAGQQAEVARVQLEFLGERGGRRGRDGPQQSREEVGEGEGEEDQYRLAARKN